MLLDSLGTGLKFQLLIGTAVRLNNWKAQRCNPFYILPTHMGNESSAFCKPVLVARIHYFNIKIN
jgi:hypothetical protein